MRVGYYSPMPPERSGIADYSEFLLPALRSRVDVVVADRRFSNEVNVRLYHLGNNPQAHGWILDELRRHPGVVVLHEVGLHELVASLTLGRGDSGAYLDAVEREGGREARLLARTSLEGLLPPLWEVRPLDFPLIDELLENAVSVIVHSRFAERQLVERGYQGTVRRISFPAEPPYEIGEAGLPMDRAPIVSSVGGLTHHKRIPQLLAAFTRLRQSFPRALLLLAGPGEDALQLDARLERLGLVRGRDVLVLGHVPKRRFLSLIARSDVCVSLRWPTLGETSASVIGALGLGKAVVVSDVGWYSELPDGVVAKVPVDAHEGELLAATLDLLAGNEKVRTSLGAAAAAYVRREHGLGPAADAYIETLEDAAVSRNGNA